jgi:restriction endonuclease Mrr
MGQDELQQSQIDRIEKHLVGNGREGLLAQTARIEQKVISVEASALDAKIVALETKEMAEARLDELLTKLTILVNDTVVLTKSVDEHHKSEHFADMIKKPKFLLGFLAFFIVAHEVATAFGLGIADVLKIVGVR